MNRSKKLKKNILIIIFFIIIIMYMSDLSRFHKEHRALTRDNKFKPIVELQNHKKKLSHYAWYVFPQLKGVAKKAMVAAGIHANPSETTTTYEIQNLAEAKDFLNDPILGKNLRDYTRQIISLVKSEGPAHFKKIFSYIDFSKFRSSMTLFLKAAEANNNEDDILLFTQALSLYSPESLDAHTIELLNLPADTGASGGMATVHPPPTVAPNRNDERIQQIMTQTGMSKSDVVKLLLSGGRKRKYRKRRYQTKRRRKRKRKTRKKRRHSLRKKKRRKARKKRRHSLRKKKK